MEDDEEDDDEESQDVKGGRKNLGIIIDEDQGDQM